MNLLLIQPAAVMANIRIINGIYSNQSLCVQTVYTEYKVSVGLKS